MWHLSIYQQIRSQSRAIFSQVLRPKQFAILEACLIGLICGLAGYFLKFSVGWLGSLRVSTALIIPPILLLPIVGLLGGFTTGFLVERFAPETSGSGIPQVKSALSGMGKPLNLRVGIAKLISTTLAVGSGLTLGRQGPTVQIGAALAAWISSMVPTSPEYRRQLIASGAAAGLAAGFNAPIAGVLFVIEELLHDVSGITLGTAIIASFIGAVVSQHLGGDLLNLNLITYKTSFYPQEIPFYVVLGVLAGLLGALFCKGILTILKFYQKNLLFGLPLRIAFAGLIAGLSIALLPDGFQNNTGLRELLVGGEATVTVTFVAFIAHFFLTIIAAGSGAPGGLFAPSLILGAALGNLIGNWQLYFFDIGLPTTYALAGMGAFFCAVSRTPMTAVVIVFEITKDFHLVLPLMICAAIAYFVADKIDPGSLYDRILALSGINLTQEKSFNDMLNTIQAKDVMQSRVETLSSQITLDEVLQAFSRSHHRGFPVVNSGKLVGIVTQTDLVKANQKKLEGDTILQEIMTPQPLTVSPQDTLSEVLYQLNRFNMSRLPVTEGYHLVGIITRSDIIRAESAQLTGQIDQIGPQFAPSYVAYQTRQPQVGNGRLLVSLSNPETMPALLNIAAAIAKEKNYEIECLQVMVVPRKSPPSQTEVRTTMSRRLLHDAERILKPWDLSVHTQIRLCHEIAPAILETIKERHIDLIIMGWQGVNSTPGRIFGNVVDTIIRQASCEVIFVKLGKNFELKKQWKGARKEDTELSPLALRLSFLNKSQESEKESVTPLNRWLVPVRDWNKAAAVRLLPSLVMISGKPEIHLCQVHQPSGNGPDPAQLQQAADFLKTRLHCPVQVTSICAKSVSDAVLDLAEKQFCDVIVLGASREGLLTQVVKGNIPEAIARNSESTVILVRPAV